MMACTRAAAALGCAGPAGLGAILLGGVGSLLGQAAIWLSVMPARSWH